MCVNGITLQQAKNAKCLGVTFDENLTWESHLTNVIQKVLADIGMLRRMKKIVPREHLISVYKSINLLLSPIFSIVVWFGIPLGPI